MAFPQNILSEYSVQVMDFAIAWKLLYRERGVRVIRILIVDDEKPICDLIDMNLSAAGYQCESVQDGLEAIARIEKGGLDLILLDIMLPGADGYDILDYIRPMGIPVIFITAKHEVKGGG